MSKMKQNKGETMDETLKVLCKALTEEAGAAIKYTYKIKDLRAVKASTDVIQQMEKIRLDNITNIQRLCIQLTNLFTPEETDKE